MSTVYRAFLYLLVPLVFVFAGCAKEPWVKPYERELLADPIMSFSRDPIHDSYRQHVYDVREATRENTKTDGGGCGCN